MPFLCEWCYLMYKIFFISSKPTTAATRWIFRDVDLSFPTVDKVVNLSPIDGPSIYQKVALRGAGLKFRCPRRTHLWWIPMGQISRASSGRSSEHSKVLWNFKKFSFPASDSFRALATYRIFLQKWRFEHMYLRWRSLYRSDELNITF
jgi:hypothetical protein